MSLPALNALADQIKTITHGSLVAENVRVHPPELWNDTAVQIRAFPTVIVAEQLGVENQWIAKAQGIGLHKFTAEIMVFLAPIIKENGLELPRFQDEQLSRGWELAMANALFANRTLGGNAHYIGDVGSYPYQLFEATHGRLYWFDEPNQEPSPYWGVRFLLPITTSHYQTMGF